MGWLEPPGCWRQGRRSRRSQRAGWSGPGRRGGRSCLKPPWRELLSVLWSSRGFLSAIWFSSPPRRGRSSRPLSCLGQAGWSLPVSPEEMRCIEKRDIDIDSTFLFSFSTNIFLLFFLCCVQKETTKKIWFKEPFSTVPLSYVCKAQNALFSLHFFKNWIIPNQTNCSEYH